MNEQQVMISRQKKEINKRNSTLQQVQNRNRDTGKQIEKKKHIKTNNKSFFREWNKKLAREYVGAINGQGIKGIFKEGNPARENLSNFLHFCWQSKKIRNLSRNKYFFLNYISKFALS